MSIKALQRTAVLCSRCSRRVLWPPSLSLGRWAALEKANGDSEACA